MKPFLPLICLTMLLTVMAEESKGDWNPDVRRLFILEERDAALQKLLLEARYPENPRYREKTAGKVKEVVVCPQPRALPLVTVFVHSDYDKDKVSARSGHLIVIRADGMILPFYQGANSLDGCLLDLNTDGVIDFIDSWDMEAADRLVTSLHMVPITEDFKPTLLIFWKPDRFTWRLHQPDRRSNPILQLGTTTDSSFTVVAEYQWSKELNLWLGPAGSPQQGFLVVDGDPKDAALRLLGKNAP